MSAPTLSSLLSEHAGTLLRFVARHGRGLSRYESAEDLAQGVCARALATERFEYRGEREFFAWLWTLARRYIAERHAYWTAMKRGAGRVLRVTGGAGSTMGGSAVVPAAPSGAEPIRFAERRELLLASARALAALPERDRRLVRMRADEWSIEEQARELGLGYDATQRAGLRALERYRRLIELDRRRRQSRG